MLDSVILIRNLNKVSLVARKNILKSLKISSKDIYIQKVRAKAFS